MESLFFNQKLTGLFLHSCLQFADCCFTRILRGLVVSFTFIALPTLLLLPTFTNGNATTGKYILQQMQSSLSITGKVTNEGGLPLEGVTVQVKGQTTYTTTDATGSFTINAPGSSAVLVFSYIGMQTLERQVPASGVMTVELQQDQSTLSDVVVVGYGTQKKINLTGSVSSVSAKTLLERPATNATNLLQGRIAGLQVTQSSGQPGKDDGILQIRGLGSFGASPTPLVLVDGVIGSLSNLSPNDIENITVLKDAASASIYGSRAANGVILVTTKKGKGSSIEYKIDVGVHEATRLPDLIYNSAEYMEMYNSAAERSGVATRYPQDQIDAYKNATDRNQYPNFNWLDYYFNPATVINHYVSVANATEKSSYKFSLSYLDQDGILPNINYKRYNAQLNFNNQITRKINVGTIISGVFKDNHEPPNWSETSVLSVYQAGPLYGPYLPDGSGRKSGRAYAFEPHNTTSPVAFSNGARYTKNYAINAQAYVNIDLLKDLKWTTKAAINYSDLTQKDHIYATQEHYFYQKLPGESDYTLDGGIVAPTSVGVTDYYSKSILPSMYSTLNYDTKIGTGHNVTALLGYEQQSFRNQYLSGNRTTFPTTGLMELDAGSAAVQSTGGSTYEWALRSYFGRIAYNFEGKYLVEANARYDGTSRVSQDNRWGLFPSVSAGWRISEENFIRNNLPWVNDLKFRASWGKLGNQEIGTYPYQAILGITNYAFGPNLMQGAQLTRLTDPGLRWESTSIIDFGIDLDIYDGLFGMAVDWFKKNTTDILATLPVPISLGLSGPTTNDGELQNIGWEMDLRHRNKIGEVSYGVNFLLSTFKNKLLSIVTPTLGVREVGLPYNSFYMYEMLGVWQSQDEIDKSPKQVFYNPKPGDLKYVDQNGDDLIDAEDRISISPFPDFTYSFGFNVGWKGFHLSAFFQGVEGLKSRVYGWAYDPFVQGDPPSTRFRDAWTPTNPSNTVPAVYIGSGWYEGGYGGVYAYGSTYHLLDASYLRLKNVNLSYELPQRIVSRIKSKGVTLYVSGDNLLTFTKYPGVDPERPMDGPNGGRGSVYPQVRILNAGLMVKF